MKRIRLGMAVSGLALSVVLAGCAREDAPVAENREAAEKMAGQAEERSEYLQKMETQIAALETRLNQMKTEKGQKAGAAQDQMKDIQESIAELRQEVAELRNINEQTWFAAQERAMERSVE
ncbi:MAG: hypothetical protein ACRD7E_31955, partial [Bryobacteraceae bacterium]